MMASKPNPTGSHDDGPDDPFQSVEWERYAAHAREQLIPMVKDASVTMFLASSSEPDVKQALELGMMILLNKPIITILMEGQRPQDLPSALRAVSTAFLSGPVTRQGFGVELKTLVDEVASR